MYGLLLENMSDYIITKYGLDRWEEIRRLANVEQPSFSVHQVYPENLIPRLSKRAIQVLGVTEREFFEGMGVHFVGFVSQYGYDRVLSVLGRHMRDFLNGLDNLHEYLKFSYPRMRAPSFICENETRQGLTLHYRSKRRGFVYYTMGQIKEVARHFYRKDMCIEVVREELLVDTVHVTFQLTFDNRAFGLASLTMTREEKHLPVSASVLFEIFPFCVVFSSDMVVRSIGNSLMVILPDLVGNKITNWFDLVRPLIAFQFQKILNRTNNIFELVTVEPVLTGRSFDRKRSVILSDESSDNPTEKNLRLKGQMIYMDDWRMMMYLGTPVMPDLSSLVSTGLYINDLPMHDFSRDLMLAGTQQSVELKLALDQEQHKSKKLEESMRRLDMEMRRTDELLYQMIPKAVADRLRTGENPIDTCQMFDSVSILFADVVTFTEICSRLSPMEVVSMLNGMYSIFDTLTERNKVYKVETIGDAYMVVSGAPEKEDNHAEKVCDMALDMLDAIKGLKDPSTGSHLQIRVGVHSGAVVAGIVGLKMPRYCLFGDSVNTASRMESTSEAMRIHVSQPTRELLPSSYKVVERGEVQVKGKGAMKTYWLEGRDPADTRTLDGAGDLEVEQEQHQEEPAKEPPDDLDDDRRVYSPVTFQEIAKRSVGSSPNRAARSNSTGTVQMLKTPVGSLAGAVVGSCSRLAKPLPLTQDDTYSQLATRRPSWNPPLGMSTEGEPPGPQEAPKKRAGSLSVPFSSHATTFQLLCGGARRGQDILWPTRPPARPPPRGFLFSILLWQWPEVTRDTFGLKVRTVAPRAQEHVKQCSEEHVEPCFQECMEPCVQKRVEPCVRETEEPCVRKPEEREAQEHLEPHAQEHVDEHRDDLEPASQEHPKHGVQAGLKPRAQRLLESTRAALEPRTLVHCAAQAQPDTVNHATSPILLNCKRNRDHDSPFASSFSAEGVTDTYASDSCSAALQLGLRACTSELEDHPASATSSDSDVAVDPARPRTLPAGTQRALRTVTPSPMRNPLCSMSRTTRQTASEGSLLSASRPLSPRLPQPPRSQSHHHHFHHYHHHHHGCNGDIGVSSTSQRPARSTRPGRPRRSKSTGCCVT